MDFEYRRMFLPRFASNASLIFAHSYILLQEGFYKMHGIGSLEFGKGESLGNYNGEKQKKRGPMSLKRRFRLFCWQNGSGKGLILLLFLHLLFLF